MSTKSVQEDEYKRVNFTELLQMAKWSLHLMYTIHPFDTVVSIATKIIQSFNPIIYTYIYAKIIDQLIKTISQSGNIESMYPYLWGLGFYYLYTSLMQLIANNSSGVIRQTSYSDIKQLFYHKLNSLGIQNLENPEINNKIFRTDNIINRVFEYFIDIVNLMATCISTISTGVSVFFISPLLIIIVVLISLPKYLIDKKYQMILYKFIYESTEKSRAASASANSLSRSHDLEEISLNSAFYFLHQKYKDFSTFYNKKTIGWHKEWWLYSGIVNFISNIILLIGYLKIFTYLIAKTITIGQTTFYMSLLNMFQQKLDQTFEQTNDLFELSVRMREAYELFSLNPAIDDGTIIIKTLTTGPNIDIKNLSFAYPNSQKLIFDNFNLSIKSGEKVAIVGHNGAGKTTLIKLIGRIYTPASGSILVNNINLNQIKINSWYNNLGILFQSYNTYPQLTVKENIHMGKPEGPIDETAVRLAAMSADAIDFIEEYPNKFDQILSEQYKGGIRPSTGQWQKIAIARFFYRNAPMVIFDEPTAAIDAVSEYNIFNKIYEFFTDKTVLIISHRFSTVRNADRIIVLEKGKIIEQGSHTDLMSKNGYYAKAFLLQAQGYQN